MLVHLGMLGLLLWQAYSCYFLLEAYGVLAFFLWPVRTWALLLSLLLVYRAWKGPSPTYTATAKPAWPPDPAFTLMLTGWFGLFNSLLFLNYFISK